LVKTPREETEAQQIINRRDNNAESDLTKYEIILAAKETRDKTK